jgi:glycosyltransferase involved in cell wall biosynthesis
MKSICIIPIYNEYDKLNILFSKIKKNKHKNFGLTYLAINNGSSDQSLNLIKKNKIKYINLKKNYGVGYALMSGYLYAKKNRYDYIVHLAGNGKMDPAQIKNFLKKIHFDNYDFVSGSRFLKNGFYSIQFYFYYKTLMGFPQNSNLIPPRHCRQEKCHCLPRTHENFHETCVRQ